MIETLEGVKNAREITRVPGVDGLFAAAGDIGNFSGYGEGDPEYQMLITEIVHAAQDVGKIKCGPLGWMGARPEYSCFQAGTEAANTSRGARAEIDAAQQRWAAAQGAAPGAVAAGAAQLLADVNALCTTIVYEADCFAAIRRAVPSGSRRPNTTRSRPGSSRSRVRTPRTPRESGRPLPRRACP